jgi:hypothetical protein
LKYFTILVPKKTDQNKVKDCFGENQKFVCETRRAVAERAENIGIWFKILDMLAQLAVISNVSYASFHNPSKKKYNVKGNVQRPSLLYFYCTV